MNTNHSSLIRGLNIAITALAALTLICCMVGIGVLNSTKSYAYDAIASEYSYDAYEDDWYDYLDDDYWYDDDHWDDDYWHDYGHGGSHHASIQHDAALIPTASGYYSYGSDIEDAYMAVDIMYAVINGLLIWEIIVAIVVLLFGILGIVSAGKQEKLRQLMVFGVVGAVVSFLGGHIILMVLFIISAVMANKDKTAMLNANMVAVPVEVPAPAPAPAPAPVAPPVTPDVPYPGTTEQPSQDPTPKDPS